MELLSGKKILLGVTGGIAAYKSAVLARELVKRGADVRVVLTEGAKAFITPMTFQALTGNPVHDSLLDPQAEAAMGHIELAKWADIILIAPATAQCIARLAQGMADDLLSTLSLASSARKYLAPAMNQQMWRSPATQRNIATLKSDGFILFGPDAGEQACGDVGPGRMIEPEVLAQSLHLDLLARSLNIQMAGLKVVITAGPTREAIDPVRYISNHSSGKMGYSLAQAAQICGAEVTLISGPTNLTPPQNINLVRVESAEQMLLAAQQAAPSAHIFIGCAAVADYKSKAIANHKMKKQCDQDCISLELVKNPDVLATIAGENSALFCVGFAAETQNLEQYAWDKLTRKQLDLIVANDVSNSAIGFNSDENAVKVFVKRLGQNAPIDFKQSAKSELAIQLMQLIHQAYQDTRSQHG